VHTLEKKDKQCPYKRKLLLRKNDPKKEKLR
jgi:hypothetical protein